MIDRRTILQGAIAVPLAALSTGPAHGQGSLPRVAWVTPSGAAETVSFLAALRQGLANLGLRDGRDLVIEAHTADYQPERADAIAAALAARPPDVIVSMGNTVHALRRAQVRAPIVFAFSGDPVEAGLVRSFAQPEGGLTGISFLALELVGKRIELLKTVLPGMRRCGVIANAQHPGDQAERRAAERAAAAFGIETLYFETNSTPQLEASLAALARARCDAALLFPVQSVISNSARVAAWSVRERIPTISGWGPFAEQGNLMSYGSNLHEAFLRVAVFVERILKGTPPGKLPVELPLQLELVLNLKTARALGIQVPQSLLLRADRVIE